MINEILQWIALICLYLILFVKADTDPSAERAIEILRELDKPFKIRGSDGA